MLADVDHSMRCMIEETFGPTLPVMRVADAEQAIELANDGPVRAPGVGLDPRHRAGEAVARRIEAGVACVNDAQVNYAALELPMGGWKASGPRLAPRPGRDPQVLEAPVADDHAGVRGLARRRTCSRTRRRSPRRSARPSARSRRATSSTTRSGRRSPSSATPSSRRSSRPRASRTRLGSGPARPRTSAVPEAIEVALLQANPPAEQIEGLRELLDSLAENGMTPETPLAESGAHHGLAYSATCLLDEAVAG